METGPEISAEAIRRVEFRERVRGYNPRDVDEFLERVAASVERLQEHLRLARGRPGRDEVSPPPPPPAGREVDDSLRRTLELAQRAADLAVDEARQQAAAMLEAAEARAAAVVDEAEGHARALAEEATGEIAAEVGRLRVIRQRLGDEITGLTRHLEQERSTGRLWLARVGDAMEQPFGAPAGPAPLEFDQPDTTTAGDAHGPGPGTESPPGEPPGD